MSTDALRAELDTLHTLLHVAADVSFRLRPLNGDGTVEQVQSLLILLRDRSGTLHQHAELQAALPSLHRQ